MLVSGCCGGRRVRVPMRGAVKSQVKSSQGAQRQRGSLLGSDHKGYLDAYVAMCERGGVSLAEAVTRRYALVKGRQGTADAQEEDEAELALIGTPQGAEGSAARKAWFEDWAATCQQKAGDGERSERAEGSGPGGGGPSDMERMMMMKMLLSMMHNQEQGRDQPDA